MNNLPNCLKKLVSVEYLNGSDTGFVDFERGVEYGFAVLKANGWLSPEQVRNKLGKLFVELCADNFLKSKSVSQRMSFSRDDFCKGVIRRAQAKLKALYMKHAKGEQK